MNKRRLLKLAGLLEKDAENKKGIRFDLGKWGESKDPTMPLSCNTTACAMGLAALSGAFKSAGLNYEVTDYECEGYKPDLDVVCRGKYGIEAAQELFEIERNVADWLFLPEHYYTGPTTGKRGELAVAKRIRDFCAGKSAP